MLWDYVRNAPSILSQGTGSLSSVCDLPGIGGAYSTEFQSQLFLAVDPRALKGAEIKLYVRLHAPAPLPGETTWEDLKDFEWLDLESVTWDMDGQSVYTDIPMGVFYIADAKRAINSIKIEAYDGMQKTNTDLPAMDSKSRTPFEWLRWICNACGLELGLNKAQVTEFPNGSRSFTYADIDTEVTQYRHVLSHLAAALGAIAVMDRYGKLSLARIGKEAVAEITPDTRFSSEYMDTQSYYTGLSLSYKAKALQEYYKNVGTLEDNGLIIDIGANVFLQISKDSNRAAAAQAIVDSHKGITFTPYDATIPFNPAFDLLDVLAFTGGHAPTDSHGPITSIVRQIGGAMTVQCATPEELTNDMVLFGPNKKLLHKARKAVADFLARRMGLRLKENWQVFPVKHRPVDFVGYRFYRNHTTMRRRNFLRLARQCRRVRKRLDRGQRLSYTVASGLLSRAAQLKHCDGYMVRAKYFDPIGEKPLKEVIRAEEKRRLAKAA